MKTVALLPVSIADQDRFWSKVDKRGPDECWPWTVAKGHTGYGHFNIQGATRRAHRVAWHIAHGSAGDMMVCHSCDNRACCNPAHLFLGTQADNVRDMLDKGRERHPTRTHCLYGGHELTPDNLRFHPNGRRLCRACDQRRAREYRERKTA